MRPEDDKHENGDEHAAEHELPPSTWAGRERAGDAAKEEPRADEPGEDEAEERAELTDEFDQIERDLGDELAGLGNRGEQKDEAEEEPEADAEPEPAPEEEAEAEAEQEDEPEEEAEAEAEQDDVADGAGTPSGDTVEAETVALADREQAEEQALAGLRARAGEKKWEREKGAEKEAVAAGVAAARVAEDSDDGKTPKAKPLWARFLAASILIVGSVATATVISLFVYLTDIAADLRDDGRLGDKLKGKLAAVDGGDPQNILILGSDERLDLPGDKRSDTTILLRVDPDQQAISLLSIPRDLKVSIPGHGIDKFNAAYSYGGPKLTLETVKQLTGLEINHLVNINFTGFADAVNAIDCVYVDVDRRYYIPPESGVSEIDIEAGYQRLCGFYALQYVRFRHDDNDLIRAARQQDFLREARQKVPPSKLIADRNELIEIFTDHTTSDIDDPITLLELLKTFFEARNAELREVHFPADLGAESSIYVTASEEAIQETVDTFMGTEGTPGPPEAGESGDGGSEPQPDRGEGGKDGDKKDEPKPENDGPAMDDATAQGERYANQISKVRTKGGDPMVEFPIFYPTLLVPGSTINSASRAFPIDGPGDDEYRGYKMVVDVPGESFGNGLLTEYYGISGTDWHDPPILANPSESREIDGRVYDLYYDGDRLRLVGWHEKRGSSYWINNTLSQSLSEEQMLEIAVSARQLD